jgi:hypothetical protein
VSAGKFLGEAVDVVEVAVRFVLVLFVQLILVKFLVIEFRSLRSGWLSNGSMLSIRGLFGRLVGEGNCFRARSAFLFRVPLIVLEWRNDARRQHGEIVPCWLRNFSISTA